MSPDRPKVSYEGWERWRAEAISGVCVDVGQRVRAQFLTLGPPCSPRSKQNGCSRYEIQKLVHSIKKKRQERFSSSQIFSKIMSRKMNWLLGAVLGSWQSIMKGSREEILHVCLPEHSVLSFWHCMLSPSMEVARERKVDLPGDRAEAMTNNEGCQSPVSTGWVAPRSEPIALEHPELLAPEGWLCHSVQLGTYIPEHHCLLQQLPPQLRAPASSHASSANRDLLLHHPFPPLQLGLHAINVPEIQAWVQFPDTRPWRLFSGHTTF